MYCRPENGDDLPVWMGRCLSCVKQDVGSSEYDMFSIEWWTTIAGKKESRKNLAKHCWQCPWHRDATCYVKTHCSTIIYSKRRAKYEEIPETHQIKESSTSAAIANLKAHIDYND